MKEQVEVLCNYFYEVTNRENPGKMLRKRITDVITKLLEEGTSAELIREAIINRPGKIPEYVKEHTVKQVKPEPVKESKPEPIVNIHPGILKRGEFYYHPQLQLIPPPPVITQNPDGTYTKKQQEFFLRIKSSYTLEDAVEYFYKRFPYMDRNQKRDVAAMDYLLTKVATPAVNNSGVEDMQAIDLLLFSIDAAWALASDKDEKLTKLLHVTDYMDEGLLIYYDKREGCIHAGINHVI